ncbi:MAG TPA: lysylphosphatidylglycerol synthase transmembrane domain-containing protein [Gaiellaceae bacterium]|nr:lysylphosphatidylglycerol synthase transmembrane domain-containing protein [Gaiellaceae bacterium]HET8651533.1 lysylphosphatidylglycerol synthase transmembrane domain-containing protein [Gaiellaceae bacterium]
MRTLVDGIVARRRLLVVLQVVFVAALLAFLAWAVRDTWSEALPKLRDADPLELGIACVILAVYYLMFVVGWQWILRALGIHTSYSVALQSEMASMLAKYIPGGIWTPAARVLWLRKAGRVDKTSVVVASILLEAGLSAVAGVLVLVCALPFVSGWDAPIWPVVLFGAGVAGLLHPRVFRAVARVAFKPFGAAEPPSLPWRTMLGLLVFYSASWIVGGVALLFLIRAIGGDAGLDAAPYLGGTAAVGAIVAVLSVLAPSGLGVREASMYGLMLAVASAPVALGATVLNRLAITLVEAVLLGVGVLAWRAGRRERGDLSASSAGSA